MTIEEISRQYNEVFVMSTKQEIWMNFSIILIIAILLIIFLFKDFSIISTIGSLLIASIVGAFIIFITTNYIDSVERGRLAEWEKRVREDYINHLPVNKLEVDQYREISALTSRVYFTDNSRVRIRNFELTGTKDQSPFKIRIGVRVKEMENLDQPYLEYQYFPKDIGTFQEGYANPKLYLPK